MGRHNGSWSKFHPRIRDHAKTRAAVAVLVEAGIPPEFAAPIVIAAVPSLAAWALSNGDDGVTGGLTDARFLQETWPESVESKKWGKPMIAGALLRRALHAAPEGHATGFLEGDGPEERLHDFTDHYGEVIAHRRRNRPRLVARSPAPNSGGPPASSPARSPASSPARTVARSPARIRGDTRARMADPEAEAETEAAADPEGGMLPPPAATPPAEAEPGPIQDATDSVVGALAGATGKAIDACRSAVAEALAAGVPLAHLDRQLTEDPPTKGASVFDWKRGVVAAWDAEHGRPKPSGPPSRFAGLDATAVPDSNGVGAAQREAERRESEARQAEYLAWLAIPGNQGKTRADWYTERRKARSA